MLDLALSCLVHAGLFPYPLAYTSSDGHRQAKCGAWSWSHGSRPLPLWFAQNHDAQGCRRQSLAAIPRTAGRGGCYKLWLSPVDGRLPAGAAVAPGGKGGVAHIDQAWSIRSTLVTRIQPHFPCVFSHHNQPLSSRSHWNSSPTSTGNSVAS